jgi:hypothetical protein
MKFKKESFYRGGKEEMTENQTYTKKDIYHAFNMGLQSAILFLERAKELEPDEIHYLAESLKKLTPC